MKDLIKYICLFSIVCIGIFMVSCGSSSNSDGKSENNTNSQLKAIADLDIDSLSVNHTKAFEQRAIQKLQDLKDYFEILSDPMIDTVFKNQAAEMAGGLFVSKEDSIAFPLLEETENQALQVDSFFTYLKNNTYGKLTLEIHNISVVNRIEKLGDLEYEGAIKFRLFVLTKQKTYKMDMQSEIFVKKVQKEFGEESKKVWEVFLGNVFRVP